jgi:hypothetical protein
MTLPVGPLAPYITPAMLTAAPTGISWSTIPPGRTTTDEERYAEQLNICMRATGEVDAWCNQVLRATIDTETVTGPDFRMTFQQATGNTRVIMSRWPVLDVVQVRVSANQVPRSWTTLPANQAEPEWPPIGVYGASQPSDAGGGGQSILIGGGAINWGLGRMGYAAQVQYVNGWPHCSLTEAVAEGATTVEVDDCTGWALTGSGGQPGAVGTFYDAGSQEVGQVIASSVTAGPGTLTLSSPLRYAHAANVLFSCLPQSVQWAAMLFSAAQALTRGATSTTVQTIPGGQGSSQGRAGADGLVDRAKKTLQPFRRTI